MKDIKGKCCGVRFKKRGPYDNHIVVSLLIGDDENWIEKDFCVSSFWLDDLIGVLTEAQNKLKRLAIEEERGFGYRFKKEQV